MAYVDSFVIPAHPSIYVEEIKERNLEVYYAIPDGGVNSKTKMIVFASGFGGHSKSNVYQKMRAEFADRYNCVTVQCEYFGSNFMQGAERFQVTEQTEREINQLLSKDELRVFHQEPSKFLELIQKHSASLTVQAVHERQETLHHFNDMGLMQAIDVITAIKALQLILKDNQMPIIKNEIIGYGHSHGAYILQLASIIEPNLFSHIVDNSAWTEPQYLKSNRYLFSQYGKATLQIEFSYLAQQISLLVENLSIEQLWKHHQNRVHFIMYQGTDDNLIDHTYKELFFREKENIVYYEITEKDVDGESIKSNTHGLNADFLKLFERAYSELEHLNIQDKVEESNIIKIGKIILKKETATPLPTYRLLNLSM